MNLVVKDNTVWQKKPRLWNCKIQLFIPSQLITDRATYLTFSNIQFSLLFFKVDLIFIHGFSVACGLLSRCGAQAPECAGSLCGARA